MIYYGRTRELLPVPSSNRQACGDNIGFLDFEPGTIAESMDERLGILTGSFLSGLLGYVVLRSALKKGQGGRREER